MEYKVHVDAGKEDCYWQYVHPGATLYVSYQVLKGGDGSIGMAVRYNLIYLQNIIFLYLSRGYRTKERGTEFFLLFGRIRNYFFLINK